MNSHKEDGCLLCSAIMPSVPVLAHCQIRTVYFLSQAQKRCTCPCRDPLNVYYSKGVGCREDYKGNWGHSMAAADQASHPCQHCRTHMGPVPRGPGTCWATSELCLAIHPCEVACCLPHDQSLPLGMRSHHPYPPCCPPAWGRQWWAISNNVPTLDLFQDSECPFPPRRC